MSKYFTNFPKITHTGRLGTDITRRAILRATAKLNQFAFHPYEIKNDMRADQIAYLYYGSPDYTWLVWASNQIIDPYHEWPMSDIDFERYFISKYSNKANATGFDVIAWGQNKSISNNIIHYENTNDESLIISKDTFEYSTEIIQDEWNAVRYYDYEENLNENRRLISLLDSDYAAQAEKELRELLNGKLYS